MRIERSQHAIDGAVDKIFGLDILDIIFLDDGEYVGKSF
jgi:hypothetical protein